MNREVFDRLINEFTEVNDRANKCREFILDKEKFDTLDNLNKDLLIAQLKAMEAYASILSIRIGLNAQKDNTSETNTEESE